jgi:hypothetical protein
MEKWNDIAAFEHPTYVSELNYLKDPKNQAAIIFNFNDELSYASDGFETLEALYDATEKLSVVP